MSVAIPQELVDRPQWVVWKREHRDGKQTKVPYCATDPSRRASSTDPATWSDYLTARDTVEIGGLAAGIGYVFAADDPYVGIDLDAGLPDETRLEIVSALDSYAETSVSGQGVHIIVRASMAGHGRNRKGPLEIYEQGRYFCMTGNHLAGTPPEIADRQAELEAVLAQYLPKPPPAPKPQPAQPITLDDRDLLERAFAAKNGTELQDLYAGRWEGRYPSQSEADYALCGSLAFWTQRDPARIDSLFRGSGLMRPKWDERHGDGTYGARTIEGAIAATTKVWDPQPRRLRALPPAGAGPADPDQAPPDEEDDRRLDDIGNGRRFAAEHRDTLRYIPAWRSWLQWDGRRWADDDTLEHLRLAQQTARALVTEAVAEPDENLRKALLQWAHRSADIRRARAMLEYGGSRLALTHPLLDQDPWALNTENGTVNLQTGELRPHDRDELHSKLAGAPYHPDAEAPAWQAFLNRVIPDPAVQLFLQRAAGYTLAGGNPEQCLLILWGSGANGKSTFIEAMRKIFGDYGQQAAPEVFLATRSQIPNDVARLRGARFVACTEIGEGRRLNEPLIKRMTGGDTMTARFLRAEYFEFQPQFCPWLASNHRPEIKGTDEAIWRRIRLVPFTEFIPPTERDARLPEKLATELPGILRWAIEGCLGWQADGLAAPAAVLAATSAYRADEDQLAGFIEDRCRIAQGASALAGNLYSAWQEWAREQGAENLSAKAFGMRLRDRGLENTRSSKGRYWNGISLLSDQQELET